jgi:hypothetical protein
VSGQCHAPAVIYPLGKDPRNPLDRRTVGHQSRSVHRGYIKILLPLLGIEPRSPDRRVRSQTIYSLSYPSSIHIYIYIYKTHNSISEYWASARFFHLTLFLAVCFLSFQDFPVIFISCSTVLLHATFGLPHPRLPCGFQSKASRGISLGGLRSIWPSHPHRISKSILMWLVLVHRSLSDIWAGQNMRKILRMHFLMKTCNCFVIVLLAFHVSQP